MAFLGPAVPLISTLLTVGSTIVQSTQKSGSAKGAAAAAKDRNERVQKEFLATRRDDQLRTKLSSGSGQRTVLGGSSGASTDATVGRNVLLGQ